MTREELIEAKIQQVRDGLKPLFIGFSLTQKQYEELLPCVNDPKYLSTLQSRVEAE